jgi:hypothetical protein
MACLAGYFMAADELTSTLGTEEILFAITFFPFLDILGLWQWGHLVSMVIDMIS